MNEILISIDNLSKKYSSSEEYSLTNISLNIYKGDKLGIVGPNGAGKTTLVSILCGVLPFNEGVVKYHYNNCNIKVKEIKKKMGFVPQDLALYNELSAFQNIEYFGSLYNLSKKQIQNKSKELFDLLGLNDVKSKKVKNFSGGMKRRLNLAIGVIHNPDILFLDEPTVGVDIHSKNAILSHINTLNNNGTTIIYTSHHLEEAEQLCTKIGILDYGKLIAFDETKNLLSSNNVTNLTQLIIKLTGNEFRDNV